MIRVEEEYLFESRQHRLVVYFGDERICEGSWETQYSNLGAESLQYEFETKWNQFQAEKFKEWLVND